MDSYKTLKSNDLIILRGIMVSRRKAANLSQKEVAEKLGWPHQFISKIEIGERRMDLLEFLKISDAIGFSAETFITELREGIKKAAT